MIFGLIFEGGMGGHGRGGLRLGGVPHSPETWGLNRKCEELISVIMTSMGASRTPFRTPPRITHSQEVFRTPHR